MSGGSSGATYYLPGNVEEVTPTGALTKYYTAGGLTLGLNTAPDASGLSYLVSDGLGSVSEALAPSGLMTAGQLYSPYGAVRYTTVGTLPTNRGFTGQYADTSSDGLDYYGARYYDPLLGQFTSADTVADGTDGLNRYGYVKGNPETFTDPTGHRLCSEDGCGEGGGEGGIVGGRGGPGGPADTLYYWYRLMHGANNVPIQTTIQLGGGAAVTVMLTQGNLMVYYQDGVSTPTWFDATNTPVQGAWLTVLSQHLTGGAPTGPARPGRMGVLATAGLTPLQRAQGIADAFGGSPPTQSRNDIGYTTQITLRGPNGQQAVVGVRSSDPSNNPTYTPYGPYFRAYVERGGPGGYMGFDGAQDPDAHFYLGYDGEANDLMLQVAMVGTILYQRYG